MASDTWQELMKCGRFEEAWTVCDRSILQRHGHPRHDGPRHFQNIWNGTPLADKRVLIRCYHGLGDTLQFLRYVPLVRAVASETTLWVQPSLIELVRPALPGVRLLALHDGSPDVPFDVDIEIMELPHAFRTTMATIPPAILRSRATGRRKGDVPDIGVRWTAGTWDHHRNVPFEVLRPLLNVPDVRFVSLQEHLNAHEQEYFARMSPVDICGLARRIIACDLIITVDTMVAHLSGSLGCPTWTLLKLDADWRWLANRDDSPWYPSMRLYRQQTAGHWEPAIARIRADLTSVFGRPIVEADHSRPGVAEAQDAD